MTAFTKDNLIFGRGGYLMYQPTDTQGCVSQLFVARFKYFNAASSRRAFANFLIKNFTVEEYFAARSDVGPNPGSLRIANSPLEIVERKGFILPHIRTRARRGDPEAQAYIARRAS